MPAPSRGGVVFVMVAGGIPALLAARGASWLVAGRALRPLEQVAATAGAIGSSRDFGRRLPQPRRRDEVATLAASFNWMLEQLQEAYNSQRRFLAHPPPQTPRPPPTSPPNPPPPP